MASDDNMGAPAARDERQGAMLVYILYLLSYATGITAIAGVVIAHMKAGTMDEKWRGHYQYQIRTFWLGILTAIAGFVLMMVLVGWLVYLWLAVWFAVRSIKGLLRALNDEPLDNPETLLW